MLKKLLTAVVTVAAAIALFANQPAYAADATAGAQVFNANCAACHTGGRNVVNPAKTLKKSDLEQYGMYDANAIITQVTNGKAAMPAFGSKLDAAQIENVAAYVLAQADNDWAK